MTIRKIHLILVVPAAYITGLYLIFSGDWREVLAVLALTLFVLPIFLGAIVMILDVSGLFHPLKKMIAAAIGWEYRCAEYDADCKQWVRKEE